MYGKDQAMEMSCRRTPSGLDGAGQSPLDLDTGSPWCGAGSRFAAREGCRTSGCEAEGRKHPGVPEATRPMRQTSPIPSTKRSIISSAPARKASFLQAYRLSGRWWTSAHQADRGGAGPPTRLRISNRRAAIDGGDHSTTSVQSPGKYPPRWTGYVTRQRQVDETLCSGRGPVRRAGADRATCSKSCYPSSASRRGPRIHPRRLLSPRDRDDRRKLGDQAGSAVATLCGCKLWSRYSPTRYKHIALVDSGSLLNCGDWQKVNGPNGR